MRIPNEIPVLSLSGKSTIDSYEIWEHCNKGQHHNLMRTIKALINQRVIHGAQISNRQVHSINGGFQTIQVYVMNRPVAIAILGKWSIPHQIKLFKHLNIRQYLAPTNEEPAL